MLAFLLLARAAAAAARSPHAIPVRSAVGYTAEDPIWGPFFEGGLGEAQDELLAVLGCAEPSDGYVPAGVDTRATEEAVSAGCEIELPRYEGSRYVALLDECGRHSSRFYESLSCLYNSSRSGHSPRVGNTTTGTPIYGKYEATDILPELDACGAHFGPVPDSGGETYHYHVSDSPPFVVGCFGPNDDGTLVTLSECRSYYPDECDGDLTRLAALDGSVRNYDLWCPCFDADGDNTRPGADDDDDDDEREFYFVLTLSLLVALLGVYGLYKLGRCLANRLRCCRRCLGRRRDRKALGGDDDDDRHVIQLPNIGDGPWYSIEAQKLVAAALPAPPPSRPNSATVISPGPAVHPEV